MLAICLCLLNISCIIASIFGAFGVSVNSNLQVSSVIVFVPSITFVVSDIERKVEKTTLWTKGKFYQYVYMYAF